MCARLCIHGLHLLLWACANPALDEIGQKSQSEFIRELFQQDGNKQANARATQAANRKTIGKQFQDQLVQLMKTLNATEPHFVRCIKPNPLKSAHSFYGKMVLEQLKYSGVLESIAIRRAGYSARFKHEEFISRFHVLTKRKDKANLKNWVKNIASDAQLPPASYGLVRKESEVL